MDSFAGSEPREFIPFYLETETNGQPAQTSTDGRTINGSTTLQQSNEAEQTNRLTNVTDTSTTPNQVAALTMPLSLLPTAIEIIEDNTSHSSTSQDPVENTPAKISISEDLASKRPHSPDYSPRSSTGLRLRIVALERACKHILQEKSRIRQKKSRREAPQGSPGCG